MSVLRQLPKPFFVLAPMDDVTDTVFRQVVASCAKPNMFFTEFVNVEGLQSPGRPNLLRKLLFTPAEQPLVAQIWGQKPENFYKTACELADGTFAHGLGLPDGINFAGIDINMGCPDKTVVKQGACSALINNRTLAAEIIRAVQEGSHGRLPVSVKTRLGFSAIDLTWIEYLFSRKLDMLTIHLRTRREMSKVPAHWDLARSVSELRDRLAPSTLLVGNGDVISVEQGSFLAKKCGLDGIMIGRGVFHDPYVFSASSPWQTIGKKQRVELFAKHVKLFANTWKNGERNIAILNKFCKIYINGFDGAKEFRERLMASSSAAELLALLQRAE